MLLLHIAIRNNTNKNDIYQTCRCIILLIAIHDTLVPAPGHRFEVEYAFQPEARLSILLAARIGKN